MKTGTCECPICYFGCDPFDSVDLNKSCEEENGKFLPDSGMLVTYYRCANCGYCFCPEICAWSMDEFAERIYNEQYLDIDPDYVGRRPRSNGDVLATMFAGLPPTVAHLDYGGGNGFMSRVLREYGWNSSSYDAFVERGSSIEGLGKFDLITAFEVFEHVPDPNGLMRDITFLLKEDGILLFTTMVSDASIPGDGTLGWWYAAPRNGHISLFSRRSLATLANRYGFKFGSFSDLFHIFSRESPAWAFPYLKPGA